MVHNGNVNHPKKGSQIKVNPITKLKDIKIIKKLLSKQPRNLLLFTIGINTNLRASDILRIKAGQVRHLKAMDELEIKEKKTGKSRRISLNTAIIKAIKELFKKNKYDDDDYLFKTKQSSCLTVNSVHRLVKSWCKDIGLKGNYGSHTLRKTWGYHQRITFGKGLPELMVAFNHSTQKQTLDYLCVQPEEVRSLYESIL